MRHLRFVAAAAILLAACVPGLSPWTLGWTAARTPFYGAITMADQPGLNGGTVNSGMNYWNQAAGRQLFVISNTAPQVSFQAGSNFITPRGDRVVAYASQQRNPNGSMAHCTVFYDPGWATPGVPGRAPGARLWAHEIGHCLELAAHQDCTFNGVMSNCDFWGRVLAGWGPTSDDTAQLRAAGYIP